MAYENIAAAGSTPATIRFYYKTLDLFNAVILRTTYRAKNIKDNNGENQVDDYSMSQDDSELFNTELLKKAISDIFGKVLSLTQGISNSVFCNVSITLKDNTTTVVASGFSLIDNKAYNSNTVDSLDTTIESCIKYSIMQQWYEICGADEIFKTMTAFLEKAMLDLSNKTFQLRKPLIS